MFFPFLIHRTLHPGKIYPVKNNLNLTFFAHGFFNWSTRITLSASNWSTRKNIYLTFLRLENWRNCLILFQNRNFTQKFKFEDFSSNFGSNFGQKFKFCAKNLNEKSPFRAKIQC